MLYPCYDSSWYQVLDVLPQWCMAVSLLKWLWLALLYPALEFHQISKQISAVAVHRMFALHAWAFSFADVHACPQVLHTKIEVLKLTADNQKIVCTLANEASLRSPVRFPSWHATTVSPPANIWTFPYWSTVLGRFCEITDFCVLNLVARAAKIRSREGIDSEFVTEWGGRRTQVGSV